MSLSLVGSRIWALIDTKYVTLNDLERHSGPHFALFLPNSVAFGTNYIKAVEDRPILPVIKM